jgi:translation initiation factor IF-3
MSVIATTQQRINREIRAREVRVIDNEGNQLGVLSLNDAIQAAWDRDLDLVEVAPTAVPPVCRILDFGKFKYAQAKKTQESKKHQRIIKIKEIKMRPKIEVHDYDFKKGHVMRFLSEGHRVKVTIMFRGREMAHTHLGRNILDRLCNDLAPYAAPENPPRLEGRNMYVYLVVKPGAVFPDSVKHIAVPEEDAHDAEDQD